MKLQPHVFYSEALLQRKTCYVLLPDDYDASEKKYPVVYLLHGMDGAETDWIYNGHAQETIELMQKQAELRECIVVVPSDGGYDRGTFYLDWYDGTGNYEQYFIYDLMGSIDQHFRTIADKQARAIVGLSMGGYGAFMLSLRNSSKFGAAASMSGAFGSFETYLGTQKARLLGPEMGPHAQGYNLHQLTALMEDDPYRPYLYFSCGTEDYVYDYNVALHEHMTSIEYPHRYQEFSGDHNWAYWTEHLRDSLQFVEQCFNMLIDSR